MTGIVQRFGRNTTGRDWIVGDVHGHFSKLAHALEGVRFDPAAGDRLFSVGDLVDRGPESEYALGWLSKPWFHAVRGNHEDFAIRWAAGQLDQRLYVVNGGAWNTATSHADRQLLAAAFLRMPVAIELETADGLLGLVHADCPLGDWRDFVHELENGDEGREELITTALWSRGRISAGLFDPIAGVHRVVVGRTPVERVTVLSNVVYLDTGAWRAPHRGFALLEASSLVVHVVKPS